MARVVKKLDNSWGKYGLDVVARPVDTYVAPEKTPEAGDEGKEYKELALALAGIHKPITRYLKTKQEEQHEEDIARGQQMYTLDGNRQSYADYMAAHQELPKRPGLKEGYLRARASNEAAILKDKMMQAYMTGEAKIVMPDGTEVNVRESDDPTVFDQWSREYMNRHITEDMGGGDMIDPESFSNIFLPQASESVKQLAGAHIKARQDDWEFKTLNETTQLMIHKLSENVADGAFVAEGIEGTLKIAEDISFLARQLRAQGFSMEKTTQSVFSAIAALADRNDIRDNERLLDIAAGVEIAPGVLMGADPTTMLKLQNTTDDQQRQKEHREQQEKKEREEAEEKLRDELGRKILLESMQKNSVNAVIDRVYNEYAALPGVSDQHISALISRIHAVHNARKPDRDPFASMYASWAKAQREAAEQNRIMSSIMAQGGKFTEDDLDRWQISDTGKTPWLRHLAGDTFKSNEMRGADMQIAEGVLMSLIMEKGVKAEDPNATLLLAGMKQDVMTELDKRIAANPDLMTDIVGRRAAIVSIVQANQKGFSDRVPVLNDFIESGGDPADSATFDVKVRENQARQEAEEQRRQAKAQEDEDRARVRQMVINYNRGNGAELTEYMRIFNLKPEDVEIATGVKPLAALTETQRRAAGRYLGGVK